MATRLGGRRPFRDRREAGRALARVLAGFATEDPVVVALPRGGVPVGYEVARALGAPLDIGLVRKLGAPMQPELGIGALGEDDLAIVDRDTVERLGISDRDIARTVALERRELERRREKYRHARPAVDVKGRFVLLVDDGLATGVTAVAAARVLRTRGARSVVLAVPVCPETVASEVSGEFDDLVCLRSPRPFRGVGGAYADFTQTSDREVLELLALAGRESEIDGRGSESGGHGTAAPAIGEREVTIEDSGVELAGTLRMPTEPTGLVIFAHGSGSSRHSPRNRVVAQRLNDAGCATLLFDLLTRHEAADRANVFDIALLARRLQAARRWAAREPELRDLPIGLFGASTGAAAALRAAAQAPGGVAAVVSRGGRPDLSGAAVLRRVHTPTLLIVGGDDEVVLKLNRQAAALLGGAGELTVVPGAGHLFEEPGALDEVSRLAAEWFHERLGAAAAGERLGAASGPGRPP